MSTKEDYYEVLGLSRNASEDDIKSAYRKTAMEYHPDRNPGDAEAEKRFKDASEAYEVLKDPEKKRVYDTYGHEGLDRTGYHGFTDVGDVFASFGDIFADLFGGGMFGDRFGARTAPQRGRSLRVALQLDLTEVARGVTKKIELRRNEPCKSCKGTGAPHGVKPSPCVQCGGRGRVVRSQGWLQMATTCPRCRGKGTVITSPCTACGGSGLQIAKRDISVTIPEGIESGQQMRLSDEGDYGENGLPPGDLYVEIHVKKHRLFHRDGTAIIFQMPISFAQAALGDEVEIPTIWGKTTLKIPEGTQSGARFTLRSQGLPPLHGGRKGSQVVITHVETPKKLTDQQRKLMEQFAETESLDIQPQKRKFFESVKDYLKNL